MELEFGPDDEDRFFILQDRDELRRLRMDELRAKLAAGLVSLDRGEGVDGDAVIDEILIDEPRAG